MREPHPMREKLEDALKEIMSQKRKLNREIESLEEELSVKKQDLYDLKEKIKKLDDEVYHMRLLEGETS